jgi:hypothetical protein
MADAVDKKKLIISSGDSSDADGFLTIPIYAKTGHDLLLFMNFNAMFNDDDMPETLDKMKEEYFTVSCADEPPHLLNTFVQKRIHRGNWMEYFLKKDLTNYKKFNDKINQTLYSDDIIGYKGGAFPTNEDNYKVWLRAVASTQEQERRALRDNLITAIFNMTVSMVTQLWKEYGAKGNLYIVAKNIETKGGATTTKFNLNKVNPFHIDYLFDEVDCYASCIDSLVETSTLDDTVIGYSLTKNTQNNTWNNIEPISNLPIENYSDVYIDFNGSFAFYQNNNRTYIEDRIDKVRGVYIMGGVLSSESPKTLSMWNIFRYSCATINQVYYPEQTAAFYTKIQAHSTRIPVYVATNNFINADASLDLGSKDEPHQVSLKILFDIHGEWMKNGIDKPPKLLIDILLAYYGTKAKPAKIFDVPVAMKLAYDMKHAKQIQQSAAVPIKGEEDKTNQFYYYYDTKYSISIVSTHNGTQHAVNEYLQNLTEKYHQMFHEAMKDEVEKLRSGADATVVSLSNLPCKLIDKDVYKVLKAEYRIGSPVYDFSDKTVHIFSDEEGGAPFRSEDNSKLFGLNFKQIKDTGKHIISGPKDKSALIFLGDIQDNSVHNIRLMQSFLQMKKDNPDHVILIGGNRDFNKVRMADEYYMLYDGSNAILADTSIEDSKKQQFTNFVHEILKNQTPLTFKWNQKDLVPGTLDVTPWHKMNHVLFDKQLKDRVLRTYLDTFAAFNDDPTNPQQANIPDRDYAAKHVKNGEYFIFKELIDMGVYKEITDNNINKDIEIAIVACLFNMVASRCWPKENLKFTIDENLIGLYVKYIAQCEICAIFKHGEKFGFVSHAGLPRFEDKLTSELGLALDFTNTIKGLVTTSATHPSDSVKLEKIVSAYKTFTTTLGDLIETKQDVNKANHKLFRAEPLVKEIIRMSAPTKYEVTDEYNIYHHSMSPPVGWFDPYGPIKQKGLVSHYHVVSLDGGAGSKYQRTVKEPLTYADLKKTPTATHVTWNIFGHQPRGVVPSVSVVDTSGDGLKLTDKTMYNICLDVSKIEGQTNENSYAMMVIGADANDNGSILGRIDLNNNNTRKMMIVYDDKTKHDQKFTMPIIYKKHIDKLVQEQTPVYFNLKFNHNFLNTETPGNQEIDTFYSIKDIQIGEKKYNLAYYSDFAGTAPWPIFKNYLIMTNVNTTPQPQPSTTTPEGIKRIDVYRNPFKIDIRDVKNNLDSMIEEEQAGAINAGAAGSEGNTGAGAAGPEGNTGAAGPGAAAGPAQGGAAKRRLYLSQLSQKQLLKHAKQHNIAGRSKMTKEELIAAVKKAMKQTKKSTSPAK